MRLYIAEKPSMGREIAKCLKGPVVRHDGYLVTGEGTVTWLFGHVLRQAEPEEYDARWKYWRTEDLPIIPRKWQLVVDAKAAKQFAIVKELIEQADEIVHAGDPDREGQLLVDEVLDYLGTKKPVRRILLNALDARSIKKANASLRDNSEFFHLRQSALARARADWLIGMNLSRAYTLAARRAGHDKIVLPIGRVKTPTLALVVRREREIEGFKPVHYYTIKGTFAHAGGSFFAQWKPKDTMAGLDSENRLVDKSLAEKWLQAFEALPHEAKITAYQKTKREEPAPLPFSLSSLQVLAGKRFGYAPQLVLDTAQKLYEHKLTTYPRSDCEYLPVNQHGDAKKILTNLAASGDAELAAWVPAANPAAKSRAWNDKKISAHHAIIPTTVRADVCKLTAEERNLYRLIARGYLAQFYPIHTYDQTKVEVTYKEEIFAARGRTERDPGWKAMYKPARRKAEHAEDSEETEDAGMLPAMKKLDMAEWTEGTLAARETKPPVRFTPATLLAGMKEIHKYVKSPEAKKQLKDVYGIGTEATRAGIIDDLIRRKFLALKGKKKQLVPTSAAYLLVDALPDEMTYPDATAIWEDKLHSMADGDGTLADFLAGQIAFTRALCAKAGAARMLVTGKNVCPRCKQGVLLQRKGKNGVFWGCSNYPKCRMTTEDRNGEPDMEAARARLAQASGGMISARALAQRMEAAPAGGPRHAPGTRRPCGSAEEPACHPAQRAPSAADEAEFASLFGAADYERELSAAAESYADFAPMRKREQDDAPKASASPLEKLASEEAAGIAPDEPSWGTIPCPACADGRLRRVLGRNGAFWGCTNYPRCTATFDDVDGTPRLN